MRGYVLPVERDVHAPPEAVFDVLVHPAKHALIDGSGMLQRSTGPEGERLALGSTFGMHMKLGVRYATVNRVVELDEGRRIAWQTGPDGTWGRFIAGRIWRYVLAPVAAGTHVTESWDITADHQRVLLKLGDRYSRKTRHDMERTLQRLDEVLGSSVPPVEERPPAG